MECYLTPELEMMILSYGEKVKVLAPDVLARRIDERIRAMTYLYTKNDDHVGES
jgi:predicted DNA-binding transcriptional regulator YafY